MSDEIKLSIIIPAYNEMMRLPESLVKISDYCKNRFPNQHEILVVNDGSTDQTIKVLEESQSKIPALKIISYSSNRGKGFAVKTGIQNAAGHTLVFCDADLSTPIEELEKLLECLKGGYPVAIGTRKHPHSNVVKHQPLWRESMGRVFTWISNRALGLNVSDFTCGFKGFNRQSALRIFQDQRIERWAFDSEILFLARYYGFPVAEVPVRWINSPDTKVRIVKDTITSFAALLKIRWNQLSGKYTL